MKTPIKILPMRLELRVTLFARGEIQYSALSTIGSLIFYSPQIYINTHIHTHTSTNQMVSYSQVISSPLLPKWLQNSGDSFLRSFTFHYWVSLEMRTYRYPRAHRQSVGGCFLPHRKRSSQPFGSCGWLVMQLQSGIRAREDLRWFIIPLTSPNTTLYRGGLP